nr:glucosidase [Chloroflexota bacterium]
GGVGGAVSTVVAEHPRLGRYILACDGAPELLFTQNDTNVERLFGAPNPTPYVKDGIAEAIVHGRAEAVNPARVGTKAAAHYRLAIEPGQTATIRLRLTSSAANGSGDPFADFDALFAQRQAEADEFYTALQPARLDEETARVQRQAFAGLLWSKQFYYYDVSQWLEGDPDQPAPPPERQRGRNREWTHFGAADIISMPDTWEYPWFAAWDLAFHCIPLALVDPDFAKEQLLLLGREWYQHPNGQPPAYEWAFGDVNPPVRAWAAWRVYKIEQKRRGEGDLLFLERMFHKLLLTFTWWVNRKDAEGHNVFQGGFLGLDNIGVFDRSAPLPTGGHLEQSDGTSWMGMFCLNMLTISLELAAHNPAYEDIATKFFEHFLYIAKALNSLGDTGIALWNDEDEFFYDVLHLGSGAAQPLKVRSMVGLIPLFAVTTIEPAQLDRLPQFKRRLEWFLEHRPDLAGLVSRWQEPGMGERRLLALLRGHRMKRVLRRMLDEQEFLSPHGVRALSRYHAEHPYVLHVEGTAHAVEYQPGESNSGLFGGNSNWRGPIWFPVNYLIVEALQQFHHYYGGDFRVECPTGSGTYLTLDEIADELSRRLIRIFLRDGEGRRPVFGGQETFQRDPHWRDYIPFHEYFHGDNGRGVGASHQTGWTALVVKLIDRSGDLIERPAPAESEPLPAGAGTPRPRPQVSGRGDPAPTAGGGVHP